MDILNTKIKSILTEKNTKILPGNIKKDVNILGITGTYTSDANATASDIKTDKTAYVNGEKITGNFAGIVPTGTIEITQNGLTDVSQYASADVNVQATSNYNAIMLTSIDTYFEIKNLIVETPVIDFTGITTLANSFSNFAKLKKINLTGTSGVTSWFKAFYYCTDLEDVALMNTSSATNFNNMFAGCSKLTNESLNNILQMCANATNYTNTKTLSAIGISSTQATTCQSLSNYSAFTSAGWTTGY